MARLKPYPLKIRWLSGTAEVVPSQELMGLLARLKPCPDTNPGFSARCEAVPSQELLVRIRCGRDLKSAAAQSSGGVAAPIPNFAEAFADSVFEESYFVAGVFEFVDIGPDFGLP